MTPDLTTELKRIVTLLEELKLSLRQSHRELEAIAVECESWCARKGDAGTHWEWCGCQLARKIREAAQLK